MVYTEQKLCGRFLISFFWRPNYYDIEMNFSQKSAFQSAKLKRCFEIIFYHFTIFGFKNVQKFVSKKISVSSVVLLNKSTSDFKPI